MRYLVLLLALSGCPPTPPVHPPQPDADAGPVTPPEPLADCSVACLNESRLACPGAAICPTICPTQLRNNGAYVRCIAAATSCRGLDACDTAPAGTGKPTGHGGSRSGP